MKYFNALLILLLILIATSCQSEEELERLFQAEEQQRIELEEIRKEEESKRQLELEQERIEKERYQEEERIRLELQRQEKELYDKYIDNVLSTGSTPYSYCFGRNSSCSDWGCSQIKVKTPHNSDVLVTIKQGEKVVRHAYIKKGSSFSFELPNGTYQPFFYYGKGWNPEKVMKETECGTLKGGFIADENFGKDNPQYLSNNILEYELILQQNGNFSTRPSDANEAF